MNNTLQTAFAWFGAITATGLLLLGIWVCAVEARRKRSRRKPITEAEIAAVDFDLGLANLTKENGR